MLIFSYLSVLTYILVLKTVSRDDSFEYPQHMFWLRYKEIIFLVRTLNYSLITVDAFNDECSVTEWVTHGLLKSFTGQLRTPWEEAFGVLSISGYLPESP